MSVSIIIPVHNESTVIQGTLERLCSGELSEHSEIIVVCNACSDNSADIAREILPAFGVLETDIPSKTRALNLGDKRAVGDVRVYMDADVTLSGKDVCELVEQLARRQLMAVSPNIKMNFEGSSLFVRAYYAVWLSLPYVKSGFMGAGVYILSKKGRRRFDEFPDVISDDGYIQGLFGKHESSRVDKVYSVVKAPTTLYGLIKIKTRSRLGGYQLLDSFPKLRKGHQKDYRSSLLPFLKRPMRWPACLIYLFVNCVCRVRARYFYKHIESYVWETDVTSRVDSVVDRSGRDRNEHLND